MKLLKFIIILLLLSYGTLAETIYLKPLWNQGDTFKYIITKNKTQYTNGNKKILKNTNSYLTVNVLNKVDDIQRIELDITESTGFNSKPILKIDDSGTLTGIENWKEIKNSVYKALEAVDASNNDSLKKVIEITKKAYKDEPSTLNTYGNYIQSLYKFIGFELDTEKPFIYTSTISNPYTNTPTAINNTITTKITSSKNLLLNCLSEVDSVSLKKSIKEFFTKNNISISKDEINNLDKILESFQMNTTFQMEFNPYINMVELNIYEAITSTQPNTKTIETITTKRIK